MIWDRSALPWLPAPPEDFAARRKALGRAAAGAVGAAGTAVRRLAAYRLNANQLAALSRTIGTLKVERTGLAPLVRITVALLGDGSHQLIADALVGTAPRHGLDVDILDIPFNSADAMALDRSSALHRARPDVVVLDFTHHAFRHAVDGSYDDRATAAALVDEAVGRIRAIRDAVHTGWGGLVVLQTLPRPAGAIFGALDRQLPGTPLSIFDRINQAVSELALSPHVLLDAAALAESVGLDAWHDAVQWHGFKLPFSQRLVPLYADHLARLLAATRGITRKCLVLDLDNTLWGGVIGDDGLEGIRLGQGLIDGEAFLDVQRTAKQLRARGVVLAVSSKNTDEVARRPFREHPDMLLAESDITVFQANWSDKAQNLEAVARELNIGTDALVLLDDNPAERELVRQRLPDVAVPELPDDPALFPQTLLAAGYFEAVSYSAEDRSRADLYAARARVATLAGTASDLGAFLESLEMVLTFAPFDAVGRSRIAQLINKSNQFNLTTRRYTEAEVLALETDPEVFTLQARLKDKFADHGMISVAICRVQAPGVWDIDTWLMSCRVLGRKIEEAVLSEIAAKAAARGVHTLVGRYIPSGRNAMVADHFERLGFERVSTSEAGSVWRLSVASYRASVLPLTCEARF